MIGEGLVRALVRRGGEDALVEHLAALLRVPGVGARFVVEVLGREAMAGTLQVETQVYDRDTGARPDLVLSNPSTVVWIEAKLGASLTEKQPAVYLDALGALGPGRGALVILAPSARWGELAARVRARVALPPGLERSFSHRGVQVIQITWRELRDFFEAQPLGEPVAAYLRSEFVALIDQDVEGLAVPFTAEMTQVLNDPKVLRALAALEDALYGLQERLKAFGYKVQGRGASGLHQTGFYVSPEGDTDEWMVWIGIISRAGVIWPGRGPVWVWLMGDAFGDDAPLEAGGIEVVDPGGRLPDWADCSLVPLAVDGGSTGEVVAGLYQQLQQIWDLAGFREGRRPER